MYWARPRRARKNNVVGNGVVKFEGGEGGGQRAFQKTNENQLNNDLARAKGMRLLSHAGLRSEKENGCSCHLGQRLVSGSTGARGCQKSVSLRAVFAYHWPSVGQCIFLPSLVPPRAVTCLISICSNDNATLLHSSLLKCMFVPGPQRQTVMRWRPSLSFRELLALFLGTWLESGEFVQS